jgi:hypothetical protein
MARPEHVRVEIAFDGGQIMGALLAPSAADELESNLASGGTGSLSLEAADGRYTVALGRIVYVKRFSRESRVGFGAGAG